MKKTLLILFLVLINNFLFSQSKRLDEMISSNIKIHYNYDSTNKYLGCQISTLNDDGVNWDLQSEINVSYNADDLINSEILSEWDGSTMINEEKFEYSYDTGLNIISHNYYYWNNTTNNWETPISATYTYNSENLISEINEYESKKTVYSYDINNKLILKEVFDWDNTDNDWRFSDKYDYNFGNSILHQEGYVYVSDGPDTNTQSWHCSENIDFTYNLNYSENDLILPFMKGYFNFFLLPSYNDMITELEAVNCDGVSQILYTYQYSDIALSVTNNNFVKHNIFPNPTSNQVKFEIENFKNIEIYDINGKKMIETKSNIVDVENLSNGVYFYKIYKENKILTGKLIKK